MRQVLITILITSLIALPMGMTIGFGLGVLSTDFGREMLTAGFARERKADVNHPRSMQGSLFTLDYPANWKLDRSAEDFDPESYFSIDTPGLSYVLFEILAVPSDPREDVDTQKDYFEGLLRASKVKEFRRWGRYPGYGVHLTGKYLGTPSDVRVFSHTSDRCSFTVTEFYDTEHTARVKPGYDMVERSFTLKQPSAEQAEAPVSE